MSPKTEQPLRVRPAELRDLEWLVRANLGLARETEDRPLDVDVVRRGVRAVLERVGLGRYLVADRDGTTIASLLLTEEWSDWHAGTYLWIQSVWVEPEERGHGAYRALWEHVKSAAREAPDVCGIRLYVEVENERAQGVYEHLGMQALPYKVYAYDTSSAPTPAQPSELLHEHTEFDDALAEHQRALVRGDLGAARDAFRRFALALSHHARMEDEVVFPIYAPIGASVVGGGLELLDAEHDKLGRMIAAMSSELDELVAPLSPETLVAWIEREQVLKHLLQHHDQRERNLVYPALDAALDEGARAALWEAVEAWRAENPRRP